MKIAIILLCLSLNLGAGELNLVPLQDLVAHIRTNLVARTNGGSTELFTAYKDGIRFTRNSKFWLNGLNGLAAVHVGYGAGATAITPWHILEANHVKNDAGAAVYFCDYQNHTVKRTVLAGVEIRPDIRSDTWLAVLNEALPDSINPMQLMPSDWTNHVFLSRLPAAALNQQREFGAAEIVSFRQPVNGWFLYGYLYDHSSLTPTMQFRPLKAGDSGHPIVTLVGKELVLLGHLTFEPGFDRFAGPDYSLYGPDIQAAIKTLGTNAAAKAQLIRTIDLSRFR